MLIIDVFNVLHAARRVDPRLAGLRIDGLTGLLERGRFTGRPVLLVCDGTAGGMARSDQPAVDPMVAASAGPGVQLVFAGQGRDADSLIEGILVEIERRGRAAGVRVVSNDRRVQAAATGARVKWMNAEKFLQALVTDAESREGKRKAATGDRPERAARESLDADSTRAWLKEFGLGADGQPVPPPTDAGGPKGWADEINLDDVDTGEWLKDDEIN